MKMRAQAPVLSVLLSVLLAVSGVQLDASGAPKIKKVQPFGKPAARPAMNTSGLEVSLIAALRSKSPGLEDLVGKVQQMMESLKPSIKENVVGIQATVTTAFQAIEKCGQNQHVDAARTLQENFAAKSALHAQCRQQEKGAFEDKEACNAELKAATEQKEDSCGAKEALEKSMYEYKTSCEVQTGETFKAFHTRNAEASLKKVKEWEKVDAECSNATAKITQQTSACTSALETFTTQQGNCNSVQDAMDSLSCSYLESATSKCTAITDCYEQTTGTYASQQTTSKSEIEALRTEWRGLLRMECIIKVFTQPEEDRSAAIDACQRQDTTSTAQQELPLTLPNIPAMPKCVVPTDTAGTSSYKAANYEGLPESAPAKECVASCCTGSTAGIAGLDFSGLSTAPSGKWQLALNIDTGDGNVVSYTNNGFWQSGTATGGATQDKAERFQRDFKDLQVFDKALAKDLLIVCHEEGKALGWRSWKLLETKTLFSWFNQGNTCPGSLSTGTQIHMASETTAADVGSLIDQEPLIKNTKDGHSDLWVNSPYTGNDFNRLSTRGKMDGGDNRGSGLGSQYDVDGITDRCGESARPTADAMLRTDRYHWGSSGGVGGLVGTDNTCHSNCPWTIKSGHHYDYAIFVMEG